MAKKANEDINKWESVEVERSTREAANRKAENLLLGEKNIKRYMNPPSDTPYILEYAYHLLGDVKGKIVLDYGCGAGENSVFLASRGAEKVIGIDISPELIELGKKRLMLHGLSETTELHVASAYALPMETESIDVVFGIAILHHLDLKLASDEVYRVLKKGGRAIFVEPVRNSRTIWFIRKLIPYQLPDVSPYERPLKDAELEKFAEKFATYRNRAFTIPFVSLAAVMKVPYRILSTTIQLDGKILKAMPFMKRYAGERAIIITK
jgi:ubiquinone/menaquinone biosynthesis C-methylase UbiE